MTQILLVFGLLAVGFAILCALMFYLAKRPRVVAADKVCLQTFGFFFAILAFAAFAAVVAIVTHFWIV